MNSSAQTPSKDFSYLHNIVTTSRRFDVEYFFVCLDASTEKLISHRAISDCFATLELAEGAQARLKARYPDCIIQGSKHYFRSENDRNRQELLAMIINDTLDTIRTGLTAHFEAENAEKQA
jgi:hypothetical protein